MNVQEKQDLDTKIFDWHLDGQPMTLIVNVSDMPTKVIGGNTELKYKNDDRVVELKQLGPGEHQYQINILYQFDLLYLRFDLWWLDLKLPSGPDALKMVA